MNFVIDFHFLSAWVLFVELKLPIELLSWEFF